MTNKTLFALMFLPSYPASCILHLSSGIEHPACSIEYQASRIENHGAHGTISTLVEKSLQIGPFCSNKPNFRKSQMNVSDFITRNYERIDTWSSGKNKPNSNPIQSQFKPNQSQNKPNTNPNKPNLLNALLLSISLALPILTHPSCQLGVVAPFSMPKFAFFPSQIAEYLPAQAIFASPNHSNHRQLQSTNL
jgi:hypothetical protein